MTIMMIFSGCSKLKACQYDVSDVFNALFHFYIVLSPTLLIYSKNVRFVRSEAGSEKGKGNGSEKGG